VFGQLTGAVKDAERVVQSRDIGAASLLPRGCHGRGGRLEDDSDEQQGVIWPHHTQPFF
jgi:hypothetical protein